MASRRTRLKAVINLPVRRAREGDHSSSSGGDKRDTESPQTRETTAKLANEVTDVVESNKYDETPKTRSCTSKTQGRPIDVNKNVRPTEEQNVKLKTEHTTPEQSSGKNIPGQSKLDNLPPPKLTIPVRKRVKPVVSLSALIRKPKEAVLENEKTIKGIESKNIKENTSSVSEKPSECNVDVQKTSSIKSPISADGVQTDDVSGLSPSRNNAQLPSKLHTDNAKLLSPTKTLSKPKFAKLTPRLIDPSTRRHSNLADVEDNLKVPTSVIQSVADATAATRLPHTPIHQTVLDTDDELENSSLFSYTAPQATQLSGKKNTTAPSVTSTIYEENLDLDDGQPSKAERRPQTHRRPRKSGVGEVLSVARRDFYKKFGSNVPDKKQLTMFDLIFYNPTSNPMKHPNKQTSTTEKLPSTESKPADAIAERIAEESVDDVVALENEVNTAVPAPQVKVGPDGSLIIDEKSLVIATTGSQKRKEELANSSVVVDYGLGNATYNSFTKKVKPKDWSKQETLKFYRALQAVGTDFLLMKSIFPTRTRGDLKQKYKKEDRLNRDLVDKALRNPLEFDLTTLEKELEQEGKENQEKEKKRLEEIARNEKLREDNERKQLLKKKGVIANALLDDLPINGPTKQTNSVKRKGEEKSNTNKTAKKPAKRKRLASDSSSSNDENTDINLEVHFDNTCELVEKAETSEEKTLEEISCDSDDDREKRFLLKSPQPTRYGRVPRARSLSEDVSVTLNQQDDDGDSNCDPLTEDVNLCSDRDQKRTSVPIHNVQPVFNMTSLNDVEPGSLVILSTPGQKTLQLFMVAPKTQNSTLTHIPVAITPEILASVNSSIGSLECEEEPSSIAINTNITNNKADT